MQKIKAIEKTQAPECDYRIVDSRVVWKEGRTVDEEWIVKSCGKKIIYEIKLSSDSRGRVYYEITPPVYSLREGKCDNVWGHNPSNKIDSENPQ